MAQNWSSAVDELRHRRREMRKELARIRWWMRLLMARRDLDIAHLSPPGETGAVDLAAAWEALAADAPTSRELAECLWGGTKAPDPGSIQRIDSLLARLVSYEERVSENLESVTAAMVEAMGSDYRAQMQAERVSHA